MEVVRELVKEAVVREEEAATVEGAVEMAAAGAMAVLPAVRGTQECEALVTAAAVWAEAAQAAVATAAAAQAA